ncbi:MAG: glycosyltransferase [Pseudohongiellaceae bacterium]
MNIVMFTNTYLPHVGGVARSVEAFTTEYRKRGHRVLIVAPEFEDQPENEEDVVRVPAILNFNGSDFSVALPPFGIIRERLNQFRPHIVHSHHPYLLGMTAVRVARFRELPVVFTHHTLYEQYIHYLPGDYTGMKQFVIELATRYANLTDQVIAPSESIMELLRQRNVTLPITVIPTGVQLELYAQGNGAAFRKRYGIPRDAFVVGHLGRLAHEKNLGFLSDAVAEFLRRRENAHFLVIGTGPAEQQMSAVMSAAGLSDRLHLAGLMENKQELADAYHAMNVFAFASRSETQGMVLSEAMAAAVPVVAVDASGVREVVQDGDNGFMLEQEDRVAFADRLARIADLPPREYERFKKGALRTADEFSLSRSADKALACYDRLCSQPFQPRTEEYRQWRRVMRLVKAEWEILEGLAAAANISLSDRSNPMKH